MLEVLRVTDKMLRFRKDGSEKAISASLGNNSSLSHKNKQPTVPTRRTVNKIKVSNPTRKSNFQIGDKVRHGQFGDGIVMSSDPTGDDLQITVAFKDGGGIKKLLQSLAKLKKI